MSQIKSQDKSQIKSQIKSPAKLQAGPEDENNAVSAAKNKPSRLGRGLSSLMSAPVSVAATAAPTVDTPVVKADTPTRDAHQASQNHAAPDTGLRLIPIGSIIPNRHQPRQRFDPVALEQLANSIRSEGVIQPILVRPVTDSHNPETAYELIAGERRWRAGQLAGLNTLPAVVNELDDRQTAEWALIENLQREDLNPIEKAHAFKNLIEQFKLSQDQVAQRIGSDRSTISNILRLLNLHEFSQTLIREGVLSAGHARALLAITDADLQLAIAKRTVKEQLSVRQLEQLTRRLTAPPSDAPAGRPGKRSPAHLEDLAQQIGRQLGTKVHIKTGRRKGTGTISIDFYSIDQFDALLKRMDVETE
ncbi:MAG: ParB/RepB/Spo0J family partition protein [Phycisphaera sp.]|nr:ParB/RepB/Spo0J family partition protein [Phycisphaera sp.]